VCIDQLICEDLQHFRRADLSYYASNFQRDVRNLLKHTKRQTAIDTPVHVYSLHAWVWRLLGCLFHALASKSRNQLGTES